MIDTAKLEEMLSQLPLYGYFFVDPTALEFSGRIRWICENECPMYGKTWACPPGVGSVEHCQKKCSRYENCLMIATITEVEDIANLEQTLATRGDHEAITDEVREMMRSLGADPYILSTEACAICDHCAFLDGQPCRYPKTMHPCVESHGINLIPTMEENGLDFQYGQNVVTWVSLLFY